MFEFGRDLRKLFERARENDDLGWLELIGADLLEAEARSQAIDAGRVSCARPHDSWMRAAALWREHERRTGRRDSLDRAASAAFVDAWVATVGDAGLAPRDPRAMRRLLELFVVEKALYEVRYELANRPPWAGVPIRGLLRLIREPETP